jgi:hypothetical protein
MHQDCRGNRRVLGGERDGGDIHLPARLQPLRPRALGVSLLVDDAQVGSGAMHPQREANRARDGSVSAALRAGCEARAAGPAV